jgi:hypothetical protein
LLLQGRIALGPPRLPLAHDGLVLLLSLAYRTQVLLFWAGYVSGWRRAVACAELLSGLRRRRGGGEAGTYVRTRGVRGVLECWSRRRVTPDRA